MRIGFRATRKTQITSAQMAQQIGKTYMDLVQKYLEFMRNMLVAAVFMGIGAAIVVAMQIDTNTIEISLPGLWRFAACLIAFAPGILALLASLLVLSLQIDGHYKARAGRLRGRIIACLFHVPVMLLIILGAHLWVVSTGASILNSMKVETR